MQIVANQHDARTIAVRDCAKLFGITEIEGGFPHSEIRGSKVVRTSPRLIAAYHVLHRLSAPRHPPNTLKTLDRSHYQRPPLGRGRMTRIMRRRDRKTFCFKHIREHCGHAMLTLVARLSIPRRIDKRSDMFPLHDDRQHASERFGPNANSIYPRTLSDPLEPIARSPAIRRLVEPDGIEPTTSCLQSTRSPN
jgi:hypothetical protein